ncbi:MAG: STAS domain-containing protein [Nostocoides sp.]
MTVEAVDHTQSVEVRVVQEARGQRAILVGRLDVHSVPDLRLTLHRLIDTSTGMLTIDLRDAEIGDAVALGLLVECQRRSRRAGRLMVCDNVCERGARLLRAVRLHPPSPIAIF